MQYPLLALGSAIAFLIIGCGSSSSSPTTLQSVLVSDAYVVNAKVTAGAVNAYEDKTREIPGWYQFEEPISENITVSGGVNDINPSNGRANNGEPYTPILKAPAYYQNVNPFTTMMLINKQEAEEKYPNAYAYNPSFNFDVVKLSIENLSIAKENAKAALELSAMNTPKRVLNLRIINGEEVETNNPTWEFIVSIQLFNSHSCGGSLIDSQWILTAAHCITDYNGDPLSWNPTAYIGSYSLSIGGINVEADNIYPHPQYSPETINSDIGLIHLKKPITRVSPIALNHTIPINDTMVQVAGWGNTKIHGSNYPDNLMQVTMPVINFQTCNDSYEYLTDSMFCAGYMDGSKDSCQGDSGGPLIQNNKLSGIVSFGGSDTQACGAPDFPGVYTKVANYIDWIESYTGPLSSSSSPSLSSSSSFSSSSSLSSNSSSSLSSFSSLSSNSSSSLSSSSSSSNPNLEEIFLEIDEAKNLIEINDIIIKYMGYYNGVYSE
jgi:trypsin